MGEKGNLLDSAARVAPGSAESLVERVTTTTTQTVVQAGEDLATKIRDKAIDSAADATVTQTRERLNRSKPAGDQADPGAAAGAGPGTTS